MTVTLIPSTAAPAAGTSSGAPLAAITATRATTFLRAQAQWLLRGLDHGDDAVAVGVVLDAHDRSHDRWVGLIDVVTKSLGSPAAGDVASLYAYFGRVAGSLEGKGLELLSPDVAVSARQLMAQRLTDLTEAVVDALWRAAAEA
jgi:hypothetical protein